MPTIKYYLPTLREVVVPLAAAIVGSLATILVGLSGSFDRNREMNIKMLEISLSILREDPEKSQIRATRGWAVDLINSVSPVPIPPDVREELIRNKWDWQTRIFTPRTPRDQALLDEFGRKFDELLDLQKKLPGHQLQALPKQK